MDYKWIGAILVFASCGGFGFALCVIHKNEEGMLRQLVSALDFMQCELQYRLTPLPELCRSAGLQASGCLRQIFLTFSRELDYRLTPDVSSSMDVALEQSHNIPPKVKAILQMLGNSLGRFDLNGQLLGLEAVRHQCREDLQNLAADKPLRLRSYQTLSLCAGAALVILFI
jgi:stage III sporulation protein AB